MTRILALYLRSSRAAHAGAAHFLRQARKAISQPPGPSEHPLGDFITVGGRSRLRATAPSERRSTRVRTKATEFVYDGSRHRRHPLLRLLPRRAADADDAARERPYCDIRPRPGRGGATGLGAEQRRNGDGVIGQERNDTIAMRIKMAAMVACLINH